MTEVSCETSEAFSSPIAAKTRCLSMVRDVNLRSHKN